MTSLKYLLFSFAFSLASIISFDAQAGRNDSRFLIGGNGYELDRSDSIVLIHTHGSRDDQSTDPCYFTVGKHSASQFLGSFRIPRVYEELRNADKRIAVFFVCHKEKGDKDGRNAERTKFAPCTPMERPLAKFCKRIAKIESELKEIKAANPTLKSSRIFLSGHSSGGLTSLILAGQTPNAINSVIAFAPATNGKIGKEFVKAGGKEKPKKKKCGRVNRGKEIHIPDVKSEGAYMLNICQLEFIRAKTPSALIFAFEEDPFVVPEMLKSLKVKNNFQLVPVKRELCGRALPFSSTPHSCHQKESFTSSYRKLISEFIYSRI